MIKIVLIVGASGVGKDSLLQSIKDKIEANFVKRYITRAPSVYEENFYIDRSYFNVLMESNFFISHWEAHGNLYGIAKKDIKDGLNIISVSRGAIDDFEKRYDDVTTIEITLPKELLRQRLILRGRESLQDIEKRLIRSYDSIQAKRLVQFENSKPLEQSSQEFLKLIKSIYHLN